MFEDASHVILSTNRFYRFYFIDLRGRVNQVFYPKTKKSHSFMRGRGLILCLFPISIRLKYLTKRSVDRLNHSTERPG